MSDTDIISLLYKEFQDLNKKTQSKIKICKSSKFLEKYTNDGQM